MVDLQLQERLGVQAARMVTRNAKTADHHRGGSERTDVACLARQAGPGDELPPARRPLPARGRGHAPRAHRAHPGPLLLGRHRGGDQRRGRPQRRARPPPRWLLDFGNATSRLLILQGERLRLARTIHAGGLHLTRQHAREGGGGLLEARAARLAADNGGGARRLPRPRPARRGAAALAPPPPRPATPRARSSGCWSAAARPPPPGACAPSRPASACPSPPSTPLRPARSAAAAGTLSGLETGSATPGWAVPFGLCHSELNL